MSTPPMSDLNIPDHMVAISAHMTNLLSEVARASAVQTAPPPPYSTNNDEVLRTLQGIVSELAGLRRDVDAIKAQLGQDHSTSNDESQQQTTKITEPNLEELMELNDPWRYPGQPDTAEVYNRIARRYNSDLRSLYDFLAPLRNSNNEQVFGFPATLGDLYYLHSTAEELLCRAFGHEYEPDAHVFATFCGVDMDLLPIPSCYDSLGGGDIVFKRVVNRYKRARDIVFHDDPTLETRRDAALHNSAARLSNAAVNPPNTISITPLHDERDLEIPGFPADYFWLSRMAKKDVLWFLGEYGLDVTEEGCLERFQEFLGIPGVPTGVERELDWLY